MAVAVKVVLVALVAPVVQTMFLPLVAVMVTEAGVTALITWVVLTSHPFASVALRV
jgi:hypothetical protein